MNARIGVAKHSFGILPWAYIDGHYQHHHRRPNSKEGLHDKADTGCYHQPLLGDKATFRVRKAGYRTRGGSKAAPMYSLWPLPMNLITLPSWLRKSPSARNTAFGSMITRPIGSRTSMGTVV